MESAAGILTTLRDDPCNDGARTDLRVRVVVHGKMFVFGNALSCGLAKTIGAALVRSGFEGQKNIDLYRPEKMFQFSRDVGSFKTVYDAVEYALQEETRLSPLCKRIKLDRTNPAIDTFLQFVEEAVTFLL